VGIRRHTPTAQLETAPQGVRRKEYLNVEGRAAKLSMPPPVQVTKRLRVGQVCGV